MNFTHKELAQLAVAMRAHIRKREQLAKKRPNPQALMDLRALYDKVMFAAKAQTFASDEQLAAARRIHVDEENVGMDDDALVSEADDGAWVQAWVWLDTSDWEKEQP